MTVQELMTAGAVTVGEDEPILAAARLLKRSNLGALPVTDRSGRLRGMVTDRDIVLRCVALETDPAKQRVGEIMSRAVVTVNPGDTASQAASLMSRNQLRRLPVTENGRLLGMVTLCDLARCNEYTMEAAAALRSISSNVRRP